MPPIRFVALKVGLEVHVELATRTKMFSRSPSPAHPDFDAAPPNSLIDPVVLALPGALPVMNREAVQMAMMVGLALNCSIATRTKWDRKSYFYPDLPKGYQISQYDLPLCFDGMVIVPPIDDKGFVTEGEPKQIGIIRAHLEEDAGKLLHEAPGGKPIDFSIVDWNRAGTPLLEIVTQPDFTAADQVVSFARMLRNICRFLSVTEGIMQKGHMRFEPNINTILTLENGKTVATPITEVKNLNSFKALRGAIEYELAEQPRRWQQDGREMGRGQKRTMGWDDARAVTLLQREKEDAHDYRYFPDPDLVPVVISQKWRDEVKARIPELPLSRQKRYVDQYGLAPKEAAALIDERDTCLFYESAIAEMEKLGIAAPRAGKLAANYILQNGAKRANERGVMVHELGIHPAEIAQLAKLREEGKLGSNAADELFGALCSESSYSPSSPTGGGAAALSGGGGSVSTASTLPPRAIGALSSQPTPRNVESLAQSLNLLIIHDDAALDRWCDEVIAKNEKVAADVRAGKTAAIGRLVGEVMKLAGGKADAKTVREALSKKLGVS
jgi:aspartyl-tRNA(Asn)/glutamyl-tRNA(Gln) amidotransferase subunit B